MAKPPQQQQIKVQWRSHQTTILGVFEELYNSQSLVDVTLAAEGQYIRAHKTILSACSPYFHELFNINHGLGEKNTIVILKDVSIKELKAIVEFIYHGQIHIMQSELPSLLRVATLLKVRGLSESSVGGDLVSKQNQNQQSNNSATNISTPQSSTQQQQQQNQINSTFSNSNTSNAIKELNNSIPLSDINNTTPSTSTTKTLPQLIPHSIHQQQQQQFAQSQLNLNTSTSLLSSDSNPNPTKRRRAKSNEDSPSQIIQQQQTPSTASPHNQNQTHDGQEPSTSSGRRASSRLQKRTRNESSNNSDSRSGDNDFLLGLGLKIKHEEEEEDKGGLFAENVVDIDDDDDPSQNPAVTDWNMSHMDETKIEDDIEEDEVEEEDQDQEQDQDALNNLMFLQGEGIQQVEDERGIQWYVCPKAGCDRKYQVYYSLVRHLKVECGVQPKFLCQICLRPFKHRHRFHSHLRNVHQKNDPDSMK